MVSNITLGQYVPGKSFLHRMDARVKIVLIIAFIVLVFVGQNYPALGIVVVSVLGVMAFSNVPVKLYFKSLRMIIFVVILTAGLNLFYGRGASLAVRLYDHYRSGHYQCGLYRFADHFLDIYQLGADVYHVADRSD